ncbi:hypothetical protein FACS1894132_07740 [Clostridia bacterium]|nr:hypothetical protein FACS1894132_07740 [Clostridia bacterium]
MFNGKDAVKFHNSYFYMNDTTDMESSADDSIPHNTLVISKVQKDYGINTIVLYKNENNKYCIGKISERFTENNILKFKITVAVTTEFEEVIAKKDIIAECMMYNANFYNFFSLLTSLTGIVGFILLPALILTILIIILIAQTTGNYGKEDRAIAPTTVKHTAKKETLKDNFGNNNFGNNSTAARIPNKIKIETIPQSPAQLVKNAIKEQEELNAQKELTPEQLAKNAINKEKFSEPKHFVNTAQFLDIPATESDNFVNTDKFSNTSSIKQPDPVRIIKVRDNKPDVEIIEPKIETTQTLKPPYIRVEPKAAETPPPRQSVASSDHLKQQTFEADSFSDLLKVVEDLERDLENFEKR